jgi:hypothetical protein
MTSFQIISLCILVAVAVANYVLPNIRLPSRKPNSLKQIEQVLAIRDTAQSPKVKTACQELLQALLQ